MLRGALHSITPIDPVFKDCSSVCPEGILHFVFSLNQKFALKIALLTDFAIFTVVFITYLHIH